MKSYEELAHKIITIVVVIVIVVILIILIICPTSW